MVYILNDRIKRLVKGYSLYMYRYAYYNNNNKNNNNNKD